MGETSEARKARTTRDRRLGRDGDPSPSMLNRSTIGEQHGRLGVAVPTEPIATPRFRQPSFRQVQI